jgi:8-oxo-dGTP diphosphatase
MSLDGQRLQPDRYSVVPRTLSFLLDRDQILLLKIPEERGPWAGKYNGVGGHIERGENPLSAARREILEETGAVLGPLELCGVVMIDTQATPGICLFVYVGELDSSKPLHSSEEGALEWIPISKVYDLPLVEDLPDLLPRTFEAYRLNKPFSAHYSYDAEKNLSIKFSA